MQKIFTFTAPSLILLATAQNPLKSTDRDFFVLTGTDLIQTSYSIS
jgi:hypothetical protein